jgi:hypothetical protein
MTKPTNQEIAAWLRQGADLFDPPEPPPSKNVLLLDLINSAHVSHDFILSDDMPDFDWLLPSAVTQPVSAKPSAIKQTRGQPTWGEGQTPGWIGPVRITRRNNDAIKVDGTGHVNIDRVWFDGFTAIDGPHIDWLQMRLGSPNVGVATSVFNCVGSNNRHGNGMQMSQVENASLALDDVVIIGGVHPLKVAAGSLLDCRNVFIVRVDATVNWSGEIERVPTPLLSSSNSYTIEEWENVFEVWPDGTMTEVPRP